MKKEVLSFFLFLMFACACPFKAMAVNVSSADELVAIANQYAATAGADEQNITLTADIDLDGVKWIPIGTKDKPFKGKFDGQGHTIKGFRTFDATDGVGLFGFIAKTGVVENLGISGGSLIAKNKRRIGAIAGVCDGTIRKCWSMAFIPVAGNVVGGLVGELSGNGKMEDCYQSGLILNAADTIGAIVGLNSGKLTRVFNVGYAKNGNAIVGFDNHGTYTDVYFDRKLYYQKSGIDGDAIIGYDVTEDMFSLFKNIPTTWSVAENRYPVLKQFESNKAAKLSAAPMFIEAGDIEPVNHANDLTNNFTVSVEGGITWACQDESDKQWIQISGKDVKVVRPCTETDVLVDSKLDTEVRVVYMRPRRVEDLLAGTFISYDDETGETGKLMGYCFDSYWELSSQSRVEYASRGWLGEGGDYHYKVEFYSIDDENNDTTLISTLLSDASTSEYRSWVENFIIPTDKAGHFLIRSWVHDNGCVTDWIENKPGFEFVVFGEFVPGEIVTKIDTILLDEIPTFVNAQSKTESYGGGGPVYYQWLLNGDTIPGQEGLTLVNYAITQPGVYTFTRQTRDSICYVPQSSVEYLGKYIVYAFDKFDPGEISNHEDTTFCSVEDAQAYVVQATSASGGVSNKGYNYQWYFKSGDVLTKINGATNMTLSLNGLTLEAGHDYTFVREAEDNTRFTTLTRSRYEKKIHIMAVLTPGAIENATWETFCFEADDNKLTPHTIIIHETTTATCSDGVVYEWIMNPGNKVVGQNAELEYTFMMGEIKLGQTYTFTRQVRNSNPDCAWVPSTGAVSQVFGKKSYHEVTTIVCANDLPFTMTLEDGKTHVFYSAADVWTVTDESGICPDITDYKIELATMPNFQLDEYVSWCQTTGTMSVYYVEDPGAPSNVFYIRYSEDLAKYMGAKDTTGVITTPGTILFDNMPNLGTGDLYLNVQIGYQAESASGVCYSTSHLMRLYPSLGGYVYSKYDRVVFVDNNPDNGALPDATEKLEFVSYQWYKNGLLQEGETGQYYHEGGAILNGVFYCMLKDTKGNSYRTCDVILPAESTSNAPQSTTVYPVPVGVGEPLSIEAFGSARIVSLAGERISEIGTIDAKAIVNAPRVPGIYFVQITTEEGRVETHKLIVK